jgi:general stress protein 26
MTESGASTDRPFMPGYGITPSAEGLLPWSWAEQRLRDSHRYWVATRGADGAPHLAAVWAVWFDGALYFSTGGESRKARNLAAEARCTIAPADSPDSVVIEGTATRLTDRAAIAAASEAYTAKYGSGLPDPSENPVYAVRPSTAIGIDEAAFTASATRWRFPA